VETMQEFVRTHNAELTIMKNGEHWFHTEEQMQFLDAWIKRLEKLQSLKKAYLSEMFPQ